MYMPSNDFNSSLLHIRAVYIFLSLLIKIFAAPLPSYPAFLAGIDLGMKRHMAQISSPFLFCWFSLLVAENLCILNDPALSFIIIACPRLRVRPSQNFPPSHMLIEVILASRGLLF